MQKVKDACKREEGESIIQPTGDSITIYTSERIADYIH